MLFSNSSKKDKHRLVKKRRKWTKRQQVNVTSNAAFRLYWRFLLYLLTVESSPLVIIIFVPLPLEFCISQFNDLDSIRFSTIYILGINNLILCVIGISWVVGFSCPCFICKVEVWSCYHKVWITVPFFYFTFVISPFNLPLTYEIGSITTPVFFIITTSYKVYTCLLYTSDAADD